MGVEDIGTYTPDNLLAGNQQCQTKKVVIKTAATFKPKRGTVLGKIKAGAVPTTGTVAGTGNGTVTGVTGSRRLKVGTYTGTILAPATNGGSFRLVDPDNKLVGVGRVGAAFTSDQLNLTVNDGSTDFIAGDSFTVVVPASADAGKYTTVDKDNIDGSGVAAGVLSQDVDASSADQTTIAYITGQFNTNALIVGATDTVADHIDDLRLMDINVVTNVVAA